MEQILIISFWNPTKQAPSKGLFIHEQVKAICQTRTDIIFLEVNILPSKNTIFQKTFVTTPFYGNTKITLTMYSVLWKLMYVSPWLIHHSLKKHLKKNHKSLAPAVIHSNVIFPCGIVGHMLAKDYAAKHIISEHWSKATKLLKHPLFGNIALHAYQKSKAILCVSNYLANEIRLATNHPNITIIPNIIDTALFRYSPKEHDNNSIRFSCCAIWKKPKRLDLIIQSIINTASGNKNKNFILNVIGDGPEKEELQACSLPPNLVIKWVGFINKEEIPQILARTDFFMHASDIETFSIVTAEALSTGTPVLASNTGALPELINLSNGILVNNTIDDWTNGVNQIIKKTYDNESIAEDVAHKYSPDAVAKRIDNVYKNS